MAKRVACLRCRERGEDRAGNNLALFEDDPTRGFCFKCNKAMSASGEAVERKQQYQEDITVDIVATYPIRLLPETAEHPVCTEVLNKYGVRSSVSEQTGKIDRIYYPYHDQDKAVVGYKVRKLPKLFSVIGKIKGLFGQSACKNNAKLLIITEGEKDCLAVAEILHRKGKDWNVVSVPLGANDEGTLDGVLRKELEWITAHQKVILCLDMDQPGQATAQALAELLASQTTVAIMQLPKKDAAKLLIGGEEDEFWNALKNCKAYRPEAIVEGAAISLDAMRRPKVFGFELPYPELQRLTRGLRKGEITLLTAGTGIGKSLWAREIMYHMVRKHGLKVATIALETNMEDNARHYVAMDNNVPGWKLMFDPNCIPVNEYERSYNELIAGGKMWFFKHWGSIKPDVLLRKMYYLAKALEVDFIELDHVSMAIAGNTESERGDIDTLFEGMTQIVEETGVGIVPIMHLKRVTGKNYNKGDEVELVDLKGSSGAEQMSYNVWALERNQQADEQVKRDLSKMRVLKNRLLGFTGPAGNAIYDHETGRLNPFEVGYND